MNKKLVKLNHLLIGIFFIIQPFIIMFQTTIIRDIQLFGISIFEGFNIAIVCASACLSILTYPNKKKFLKFIPYILALGIYLVFHGLHIYEFRGEYYSAQTPSFFVETYYICRTFVLPLILIFSIYYSQIKKEQMIKILRIFIFIIVSVMVLTNLFYIAQRNYSEVSEHNTLNLFDWFSFENVTRRSYYQLTTKGWFLSGNQMSAVLFMTFPIIVYQAYKKRTVFSYVLFGIQILAMFMLGTKVANVGCLVIVAVFVACWLLFKFLKHKEKGIITLLLITVGFAALFPFSPIGYMLRYGNDGGFSSSENSLMLDGALEIDMQDIEDMSEEQKMYYENLKRDSKIFKKLNPDSMSKEEKEFVNQYMLDYCGYFGISPFIISSYNDIEHSVFWAKYIQHTPNNDYRVLKTMILKDIYEKNDNPMDKYLGLGYTLNYIYTEADYSYQYYSYGMAGIVLLIAPYFCMLLYVIIQGLRHFKEMFTLECAMYAIPPVLGLAVAKLSGHVLERQLPLLVIGIVMSILLIHTRNVCESQEVQG